MSTAGDEATFRAEYEECLAQATQAGSPTAAKQWLAFADEWLKLAVAAEAQQLRDAESASGACE
jgi:hypothetical protein